MYQVKFSEHAVKELKKLDKPTVRVIKNWIIKNLVDTTDPRQHSKPLQGIWKEYGGTGSGITGFLREIRKDVLIVFLFEMAHRVNIFISVGSKHRVSWRPWEGKLSALLTEGSLHRLSSSIWVRGCSTSNRLRQTSNSKLQTTNYLFSRGPVPGTGLERGSLQTPRSSRLGLAANFEGSMSILYICQCWPLFLLPIRITFFSCLYCKNSSTKRLYDKIYHYVLFNPTNPLKKFIMLL